MRDHNERSGADSRRHFSFTDALGDLLRPGLSMRCVRGLRSAFG